MRRLVARDRLAQRCDGGILTDDVEKPWHAETPAGDWATATRLQVLEAVNR